MVRKLLYFLGISLTIAGAAGIHANGKFDDVSTGMRMEEALEVAKNCVIQASSFKDPRTRKIKELRPDDTLAFVGINDDFRLNTLRRYIIRNRQIGVQSVWGDPFGNGIQPYIISRTALSDISKDWTLAKLALEISNKAGLPRLPILKAQSLIANCRYEATKLTSSPKKEPALLLNTISPDMGARFDDFKKCLISEKEGGATSDYYILLNAGVTDPEGNRYNYHLHNKGMIDSVLSAGTYLDLVQALQHESEVEFSSYLTSIRTVIGALQPLHKNLRGNCSQTSYPLANLCGALPISETTTIGDLQLDPEQVKRQLNANAHNFKSKRNDDAKFPSFAMLRIDESTPLWKLIERVESVLEGVK